SPEQFDGIARAVVAPVSLLSSNQLDIRISGAPGGNVTAEILGLDTDVPPITATATPAPNAAGWNNTNVTVSFTCSDTTSGIATCPPSQVITGEGANQTIKGTTADHAGNTATASITLNIDKTPPTVIASPSPAPNAAGWNHTN